MSAVAEFHLGGVESSQTGRAGKVSSAWKRQPAQSLASSPSSHRPSSDSSGVTAGAVTGGQTEVDLSKKDHRPNIVLIVFDDSGYGDLGANHPKKSLPPHEVPEQESSRSRLASHTPFLDDLAARGLRLTSFYVTATICTPSRASLLTGRLGPRTGVTGHVAPKSRCVFSKHYCLRSTCLILGTVMPYHASHTWRGRLVFCSGGLPGSEVTMARILRSGGYDTIALGKWHLGHHAPHDPLSHGFHEWLGLPFSNDMGCTDAPLGATSAEVPDTPSAFTCPPLQGSAAQPWWVATDNETLESSQCDESATVPPPSCLSSWLRRASSVWNTMVSSVSSISRSIAIAVVHGSDYGNKYTMSIASPRREQVEHKATAQAPAQRSYQRPHPTYVNNKWTVMGNGEPTVLPLIHACDDGFVRESSDADDAPHGKRQSSSEPWAIFNRCRQAVRLTDNSMHGSCRTKTNRTKNDTSCATFRRSGNNLARNTAPFILQELEGAIREQPTNLWRLSDRLARRAEGFIHEHKRGAAESKSPRPFFVYVPLIHTHIPHTPAPHFIRDAREAETSTDGSFYGDVGADGGGGKGPRFSRGSGGVSHRKYVQSIMRAPVTKARARRPSRGTEKKADPGVAAGGSDIRGDIGTIQQQRRLHAGDGRLSGPSSDVAVYRAALREGDDMCRRVVEALDHAGVKENTLTIVTSDNGPWLRQGAMGGSPAPFRGGKFTTLEGGFRVFAVVHWPAILGGHRHVHSFGLESPVTQPLPPPGSNETEHQEFRSGTETSGPKLLWGDGRGVASDAIVSALDFLPTFAALAQAPLPDDRSLDGEDVSALLFAAGLYRQRHSRAAHVAVAAAALNKADAKERGQPTAKKAPKAPAPFVPWLTSSKPWPIGTDTAAHGIALLAANARRLLSRALLLQENEKFAALRLGRYKVSSVPRLEIRPDNWTINDLVVFDLEEDPTESHRLDIKQLELRFALALPELNTSISENGSQRAAVEAKVRQSKGNGHSVRGSGEHPYSAAPVAKPRYRDPSASDLDDELDVAFASLVSAKAAAGASGGDGSGHVAHLTTQEFRAVALYIKEAVWGDVTATLRSDGSARRDNQSPGGLPCAMPFVQGVMCTKCKCLDGFSAEVAASLPPGRPC